VAKDTQAATRRGVHPNFCEKGGDPEAGWENTTAGYSDGGGPLHPTGRHAGAAAGVDLPWKCQFLGFSFTSKHKRRISEKSIKRLKAKVREMNSRTVGICIGKIVEGLSRYLLGWQAYFNFTEARSILKELDSWIKRRLRCYLGKQWGRSG
jgi:hypothetical protein